MTEHLLDHCSIDSEWGYLYSLKDEGAAEAEKHGHHIIPLTDSQREVIKKGRQI